MLPNMKGLVEDAMYIYQGETTMSGGCSDQGGGVMSNVQSKLMVNRPREASEYPQKTPLQIYQPQSMLVALYW